MGIEFEAPAVTVPLRVVLLGAAARGWYEADDAERREKVLPRLKQIFAEWEALGARVLATVDDDLFMVGEPHAPDFSWYLIFEVPSADVLAAMVHRFRVTVDGVRADRYVRIQARIGRPFFLLEPAG